MRINFERIIQVTKINESTFKFPAVCSQKSDMSSEFIIEFAVSVARVISSATTRMRNGCRCRCSSEAAASAKPGESSVQATRTESDGGEDRGLTGRGVHERESERERERERAKEQAFTRRRLAQALSLAHEDSSFFRVYAHANEKDSEENNDRESERQRERV